MTIRKIVSRSIGVDVIAAEDLLMNSVTASEIQDGVITKQNLHLRLMVGCISADNNSDTEQVLRADIFRVHEQQLDTNVTIASTDNALRIYPLTIASSVTLTVSGNLTII